MDMTLSARPRRFLVVEDENDIAELLTLHLDELSEEVVHCADGPSALKRALGEHWDLILLDLRLPGLDGLEICRAIRAQRAYVPIIMITSRSTELDRVLGLELGADDYLCKPFSMVELQARVKAVLRRSEQMAPQADSEPERIEQGELVIDRLARKVWLGQRELPLTAREFDLLWFFARHPGRVFRRGELLDRVWGYGHEGYEHTVNAHINRLRGKLEPAGEAPRYLHTVWGVGYKFEVGA
ncbi:response regulator transcription factor [Marinobacteraceae bacterium S3BR75-40.1]